MERLLAEKVLRGMRGDRLRALLDAAADVAKGSRDRELERLAREIVHAARLRGIAV
jgi:ribonuclease HII